MTRLLLKESGGVLPMKLVSMQLPIAAVGGATLMAWRAYDIAPSSSFVEVEMAGWVMYGVMALVLGLLWELLRAYHRLNHRHNSQRTA